MGLPPKVLAGPGYIILNIIRFLNIICFLAVISASVVMVVKTVMVSQFYFFDGACHVVTAIISVCLIISELNLFRIYFVTHWPLFSPTHGIVTLGIVMVIIGINVLGNLNKPAMSQGSLGLPFWRLVIGAGALVTSFGFLNILASFIFCNNATKLTSRQVRNKEPTSTTIDRNPIPFHLDTLKQAPSISTATTAAPKQNRFSSRFTQWAGNLGVGSNTRRPELPSYRTSPVPSSHYTERHSMESSAAGLKISTPVISNPYTMNFARPESVVHAN